jgi:septal ring factor EnvC (AmiA/AmiB activator)
MPAYLQGMLQQTAENVDQLRLALERSDHARSDLHGSLTVLNDRLGQLHDQLRLDHEVLGRLLETRQLGDQTAARHATVTLDEATREHIRSTDQKLGRLIEELAHGREEITRELKNEIKLVSRTIAIAAGEPQSLRP